MRTFWAGLLFLTLFLGGGPARADVVYATPEELKTFGINTPAFLIATFSPDGRAILGHEPGTAEDVAKGVLNKIFLLQLRSDGKVTGVRRYDLDLPVVEQVSFTPDGRQVVIITKSGATYAILDLATGKVRTIMEHQSKVPGFRAHPNILWLAGGKLLTLGYFYDKDDFAGYDVIAEIDPSKSGVEAFREGPAVQPVERSLKKLVFHAYTNDHVGFFCTQEGNLQKFYRWVAGSPPAVVDEAPEFTAYMGADDRAAYAAQRATKTSEVVLYDGAKGTRQVLGTDPYPFRYLTLSRDGSTVVVTQMVQGQMKLFSASPRNGMKLARIPSLPALRSGAIRLTEDGRRMFLFSSEGLRVIDVP